jgi:hypothetical protein
MHGHPIGILMEQRERVIYSERIALSMRRKFVRRNRDLVLLALAIIIVIILWNFMGMLAEIALFAIAVYLVYSVLKYRL